MPSTRRANETAEVPALLPLLAMAALAPYVLRFVVVEVPVELAGAYGQWHVVDAYCEYKAFFILALGLLMAMIPALRALSRGEAAALLPPPTDTPRKRAREFAPLALLAATVFVSAFASDFPLTAWFGAPLRREGALILLVYATTALYGRLMVRSARGFALFFWTLTLAAPPMALWGLLQTGARWHPLNPPTPRALTTGLPAINTGRGLAAGGFRPPAEVLAEAAANPPPPLYGTENATASLFNPNYYGTYTALMLTITVAWGLSRLIDTREALDRRRRALRWGALALVVGLSGWAFLAAGNLGGGFGLATAAAATVLLAWRPLLAFLLRRKALVLALLAGGGLLLFGIAQGTERGRAYVRRALIDNLRFQWAGAADPAPGAPGRLLAMRLENNLIHLNTSAGAYTLAVRANTAAGIQLRDALGIAVPLRWGKPGADDWVAADLPAVFGEAARLRRQRNGREFEITSLIPPPYGEAKTRLRLTFVAGAQGAVLFKPNALSLRPSVQMPPPAWEPWPRFKYLGSGRGYFWSRTLPLLPGAGLFGHGPDTVAHLFPFDDVLGNTEAQLNDYVFHKLHSWYLGTWLGLGALGLAALLFFLATHFHRLGTVLRRWWTWRSRGDHEAPGDVRVYAAACLTAWAGGFTYLGALCWTDSTLHFSPVFWSLAGMGWAAAVRLRRWLDLEDSAKN